MEERFDDARGEELSADDRRFLTRYREQTPGPAFPDGEEICMLLAEPAEGDGGRTREKLLNLLLPMVPELALEFAGEGMALEDLVQEGNVGLMLALEGLRGNGFLDPAEVSAYLRGKVYDAIEDALSENQGETEKGRKIADRLNRLNDQIKELTEELGGMPSIEELSIFLEMPVEEIESLIRLTGESSEEEGSEEEEGLDGADGAV